MSDTVLRVRIDFSNVDAGPYNYVWAPILPCLFTTIHDFKTNICKKFKINEPIQLYVQDHLLMDGDTIALLRDNDLVRVTYATYVPVLENYLNTVNETDSSKKKKTKRSVEETDNSEAKKQKLLRSSMCNDNADADDVLKATDQFINGSDSYAKVKKKKSNTSHTLIDITTNEETEINENPRQTFSGREKGKLQSEVLCVNNESKNNTKYSDSNFCENDKSKKKKKNESKNIAVKKNMFIHCSSPKKFAVDISNAFSNIEYPVEKFSTPNVKNKTEEENCVNFHNMFQVSSIKAVEEAKEIAEKLVEVNETHDLNITNTATEIVPESLPSGGDDDDVIIIKSDMAHDNACEKKKRKRRRRSRKNKVESNLADSRTTSQVNIEDSTESSAFQMSFVTLGGMQIPASKHIRFSDSPEGDAHCLSLKENNDTPKSTLKVNTSNSHFEINGAANNLECKSVNGICQLLETAANIQIKDCEKMNVDSVNKPEIVQEELQIEETPIEALQSGQNIIVPPKNDFCSKGLDTKCEKSSLSQDSGYNQYPLLHSVPPVGTHIAYKILELSELYCPEVSNYKEGIIRSISNNQLEIQLLSEELKTPRLGKFENIYPGECPNPEVIKTVIVNWNELIEPRSVQKKSAM